MFSQCLGTGGGGGNQEYKARFNYTVSLVIAWTTWDSGEHKTKTKKKSKP